MKLKIYLKLRKYGSIIDNLNKVLVKDS